MKPMLFEKRVLPSKHTDAFTGLDDQTLRYVEYSCPHPGFVRHTGHQHIGFSDFVYLQGFWPDGLYTPPTAEAWVADIQMAKRLGYNTLRKHVKVEPEQCVPMTPCSLAIAFMVSILFFLLRQPKGHQHGLCMTGCYT